MTSWMCRLVLSALSFTCLMLAGTSSVVAQPADLKTNAKQYVTDGLKAQSAGRYDEAISLYNKAYELVPHPELLFNLGQAHRLKGEKAVALNYYQKYLAVDSKGRGAAEASQWAAQLDLELRKEAEARDLAEREREDAEKSRLESEAREARRKAEQRERKKDRAQDVEQRGDGPPASSSARSPSQSAPPTSEKPMVSRTALAIGLGIGGGTFMVGGLLFYARGQGLYSNYKHLKQNGAPMEESDSAYERANWNHQAAQVVALSGAVMLGAGVYLWYTRDNSKGRLEKRVTHVSPLFDGELSGIVLTGEF